MVHNCDATQIKVVECLAAVRKRPSMYIGSTSKSGLHQLVYEVVDNSIDEAMEGYCTEINVTIDKDSIVTVKDDGRGIPCDMHKEKGLPAIEVVLTTLHAGGKFGGDGYKVSGGLHGVGVSCVNALSEWLKVVVDRDGKRYNQRYQRGVPDNLVGTFEDVDPSLRGTVVIFKPDSEIFETIDFTSEIIDHRLKELAFLNKGLKITFTDNRYEIPTENVYQFEGGLQSYIESLNKNKEPLFTPPIYFKKTKGNYEVEISLQYVADYYDEQVLTFANNIRTKDGGTHLSGFRSALTRVINSYAKKYDLLKDKDQPFQGNDLREGLIAIVSIRLPNPQFEGQTKGKLENSEVKGVVESLTDEGISDALELNPKIGRSIINKALIAQRVREATRKAQDLARRKTALESTTLPGKLADCSERDPAKCEVFIVEGDSAGGSAKQGRDRNFQAILPLRGKVLNVEKAALDKILSNEELRTLITAIGPGAIAGLVMNNNDDSDKEEEEVNVLEKLRYHKIIIMTDADVDGAHIRTLLLTFFFRYARAIIEAGALYIAQPPLYLVKKGNSQTYIYNEKELENHLKTFENRDSVNIQRYKGLGEMNPEQLWETTLDPTVRTLLQVNLEDAEEADEIFTLLMGSVVEPRREFIEKYAKDVRWIDT
ncbi:MAG: DNA topoisomerase (ATP-hydrolyzing) subunit B [Candidatus Margulisiibacteriota bacterium]|jgi:DNA gyrase subunit B